MGDAPLVVRPKPSTTVVGIVLAIVSLLSGLLGVVSAFRFVDWRRENADVYLVVFFGSLLFTGPAILMFRIATARVCIASGRVTHRYYRTTACPIEEVDRVVVRGSQPPGHGDPMTGVPIPVETPESVRMLLRHHEKNFTHVILQNEAGRPAVSPINITAFRQDELEYFIDRLLAKIQRPQ